MKFQLRAALCGLAAIMFAGIVFASIAPAAASQSIPDQYPGSLLYSKPIEVIPAVWTAIGATG